MRKMIDVNKKAFHHLIEQFTQYSDKDVEAGIRSGDWTMPEEINRLVTDSITNYFFTTTELAGNNLINNGIVSCIIRNLRIQIRKII